MTPSTELHQSIAHDLLLRTGLTIAVAESCTGGLLGAALTELAGSSAYFLGGVLAYNDRVKVNLLGVDPSVIREQGAVSAAIALGMAQGVAASIQSDLGISITGIAGPGGATDTKPVGTTYIGFVAPGVERVEAFCWSGSRSANRESSVVAAYRMLVEYLRTLPNGLVGHAQLASGVLIV